MARIAKDRIMDFSGLHFKVAGVLPSDEEPDVLAPDLVTVTTAEDVEARAAISDVIAALQAVGITVAS